MKSYITAKDLESDKEVIVWIGEGVDADIIEKSLCNLTNRSIKRYNIEDEEYSRLKKSVVLQ